MRVVGIFEILDIRLHETENDLFAAKECLVEHGVLINVTFAGDGLLCERKDRRGTRSAAGGGWN
jgi:hypothetical protein